MSHQANGSMPPTRREELRSQVNDFHKDHPRVWDLFVFYTLELIERGFQHGSADAVMHRVRWETEEGNDEGWKINNNFVAFYARRFGREYPEFSGFFRTRNQTSSQRPGRSKK